MTSPVFDLNKCQYIFIRGGIPTEIRLLTVQVIESA